MDNEIYSEIKNELIMNRKINYGIVLLIAFAAACTDEKVIPPIVPSVPITDGTIGGITFSSVHAAAKAISKTMP